MDGYPNPVTKKCHEKILDQMNSSIGMIKGKDGKIEIGIFFHIKYNNEKIPALLINNYMNNYSCKNQINISINNKEKKVEIQTIIYKNIENNISIMKIKEKEKNSDIKYIEIDDILYDNEFEIFFSNKPIYIMEINNINDILISYGIIKDINNKNLIYTGNINSNYQFCPIFNLTNNKLIGIHKNKLNYYNTGIFFKNICKEYRLRKKYDVLNEISISVNIVNEDINKEIYFLDNGYKDNNIEYFELNHLKELNALNTALYINNKQYEYKKYFIPDKEGEYQIKIKFNINLIDCSYMFFGCDKITNISFLSFNTKNVVNLKYMFYGCKNLKQIHLFDWDTKNVTDISWMFSQCCLLKNLPDISQWDTKNITDMSCLFYNCSSLNDIPDISKWDTQNVTDMSHVFRNCSSLKNLTDISKWNTKKVINMSWMFSDCGLLNSLPDISK